MDLSVIEPTQKNEILPNATYTKIEAGRVTGTSESTIYRAIKGRKLKAAYVGRRVIIRGAELLKFLQGQEA